jgi:catalase
MRVRKVSDPVYAPNSKGGPRADSDHYKPPSWYTDGEIMRTAYVPHAEDDDWGQPGTMVREVLDDAARERLVNNVVGHLLNGVTEPVLQRAFEYWRNVDKNIGEKIESGVRAKQNEKDPKAAEQGNPARSSMQAKA